MNAASLRTGSRWLLGARLPPSPVLSQPADEGEWRWPLGKWKRELLLLKYRGSSAAEICMEKS